MYIISYTNHHLKHFKGVRLSLIAVDLTRFFCFDFVIYANLRIYVSVVVFNYLPKRSQKMPKYIIKNYHYVKIGNTLVKNTTDAQNS